MAINAYLPLRTDDEVNAMAADGVGIVGPRSGRDAGTAAALRDRLGAPRHAGGTAWGRVLPRGGAVAGMVGPAASAGRRPLPE